MQKQNNRNKNFYSEKMEKNVINNENFVCLNERSCRLTTIHLCH